MLTAITGVMTLFLIALVASKRQQERRQRAKGEYYALFYGRRATPKRCHGLFLGHPERPMLTPLFRA